MPISLKEFWKLAIASRLLSLDECQRLNAAYLRVPGAQHGNAVTLAEWLVSSGVLSRYQASVLAAGKARPFVFGNYKVYDRHERGRLKGLFKAVHVPSGHSVAMNFLSRDTMQDARRVAWVARQAQAAIPVRGDHLARTFEFVDLGSSKFIALEDLAGTSLAEQLAAGRVAPPEACRIARDVALAAAELHQAGLAHGDIRPDNVWLAADGSVKLLAFPLARDPSEPASFRLTDAEPGARLLAQADYLAPELAQPRRAPDSVSDLYSIGCLLYELLTGRPPYAGVELTEKLARHAALPAVGLEQFGLPAALAQLVAHLMAKNPPVRLQTAVEAAARLAPFAGAAAGSPQRPQRSLAAYEKILAEPPSDVPAAVAQPSVATDAAATDAAATDAGRPGLGPAETVVAGMSAAETSPFVLAPPAKGPAGATATVAERPRSGEAAPGHDPALGIAPAAGPYVPRKRKRTSSTMVALGVVGALSIVALIVIANATDSAPAKKHAGEPDKLASAAPLKPPRDDAPAKTAKPTKNKKPKPKARPKPRVEESDDADESSDSDMGTTASDDVDEQGLAVVSAPPVRKPPPRPPVKEVDDDGETLWVSPTNGPTISLRYLPPGAQLFMHLRPAELLASPEGSKMIDALGPAGQAARESIRGITGVDPARIDELTIGFYPSEMGSPLAAFVVRLADPAPVEELLAAWKNPTAAEHQGQKYYRGPAYAYYLPAAERGRVLAIMPPAEAVETIDAGEPPLRKEMEKLLADSDAQRHFTLLFAPFSLFTDGKNLFVGELERLQKPLDAFLGDGIQAALLSLHAGSNFFVEMRMYGQAEEDAYQLAARFRKQLAKVPDSVESYLVELNPQPYGKAILMRLPRMIESVEKYTRVAAEHKQAVLRCFLPANAGHNLVLASELALFERPGAAAVAVKGPAGKKPLTPADALKQKISLSFPRDTLEKCMEMLGREIDSEITILGSDLQLEGITKNQSFGLDERDKPAEEILRTVLKLANSDGKLVYVVKPNDAGKEAIFITTRTSAAKRGDKLPAELAQEPPPAK